MIHLLIEILGTLCLLFLVAFLLWHSGAIHFTSPATTLFFTKIEILFNLR